MAIEATYAAGIYRHALRLFRNRMSLFQRRMSDGELTPNRTLEREYAGIWVTSGEFQFYARRRAFCVRVPQRNSHSAHASDARLLRCWRI